MAARALIFDLDGTVWDSAGWFASGLAADERESACIRDDLIGGGNIVQAIARAGMSRQRMLSEAAKRSGPPPLFDGMAATLSALVAREVSLAVATSLPGTIALPMLAAAGIAESFEAVVHAGTCRIAKPHPASIQKALVMMKRRPSATVFYVGDRASDAAAAAAAGISSAWVRHGYEKPAQESGIVTLTPAELLEL